MQKRLILDSALLEVTVSRLCHQLLEDHGDFTDTVMLGLQPRGIYFAERIKTRLSALLGNPVHLGYLDTTFHRDDFRRRAQPLKANSNNVPFLIEDKKVVLIDDVLFTGRTIRAAMDAMITFGRPSKVDLLILINRRYSRDLPIEPRYVGKHVNTIRSQRVKVEWQEQGFEADNIWLALQEEDQV